MCGILFAFDENSSTQLLKSRGERSLDLIRHRGPDGEGLVAGENFIIGHRRLSIIDIESSNQPMEDSTGRYILSYNGEIYNYKQLRSDLQQYWNFATDGDTEVILAGYLKFGKSFVQRMQGMWAFVIWDREDKCLFASRDRIGKKPLYYLCAKNSMYIASELPSMCQLVPQKHLKEDKKSTVDYFKYGLNLPGHTAYENIKELQGGYSLSWSNKRSPKIEQYWRMEPYKFNFESRECGEELSSLFRGAVKKRLIADVPLGSFLSGGVDSSIITALAAEEKCTPIDTFTIKFESKTFDESGYAEAVAKFIGTNHHVRSLSEFNKEHLNTLITDHVGQPFADSSILPTSIVSQLASEYVKVALSGDGGDELFSGYQRYTARAILRWYTRVPKAMRKVAQSLVLKLPPIASHHSRSLLKKLQLFMKLYDRDDVMTPYVAPRMFSDGELKQLLRQDTLEGHEHGIPNAYVDHSSIEEMMFKDTLVYLPQDILVKVDRASMAHSLEARAPFLDTDIIEYAFSMGIKHHRKWMQGKQLLRASFNELLPNLVWQRRKQGFAVPVHEWFRGSLSNILITMVSDADDILNPSYVHKLADDHRRGKSDEGYRLWSIYSYLLWKKNAKLF